MTDYNLLLKQKNVAGTVINPATEDTLAVVSGKLDTLNNTLKAQLDLETSIWTDDSGAIYVRRETVNEGTGAITITFTNASGNVVTPGAGLRPLIGTTKVVEQAFFDATSGGTGYSAGDILARITIVDPNAVPPSVTALWLNATTGLTISAPTGGTYIEQTKNIIVPGVATETTLSAASAKFPATLGQKSSGQSLATVLSSEQEAKIDLLAKEQTSYEMGAGLNLIRNGDFEAGITGWQNQFGGVTLSSDATLFKYGSKSLKIVTDGSVQGQGALWGATTGYLGIPWLLGDVFDVVVWARGVAGQTMRVVIFDGANSVVIGTYIFLSTGVFERFYGLVTITAPLVAAAGGYFIIDTGSPAQAVTWNVDAILVTRRPAQVSRADGMRAASVADDCQAMEAQHVTLVAGQDTTVTFAGGPVRIIRVVNWDVSNVVLVKDGAIATDVDASATRVGYAPAANVPNTRTFPYMKGSIHLRSAAGSIVTVEGFR
jgi:hypothetical protein